MPGLEDNGEMPSASAPPPGEENRREQKSSGAEGGFHARLIPEFDGSTDVAEWFTRAEVLCSHRGASLVSILPGRLTGGAFPVWLQLSESERQSKTNVRDALYDAFGMDQLTAYDAYVKRRLQPGESADVYLADLRRLATLCGGVPESWMTCAFIAGLPGSVRTTIRAGTRAEALSLDSIVKRARAVLSGERNQATATARPEDRGTRA